MSANKTVAGARDRHRVHSRLRVGEQDRRRRALGYSREKEKGLVPANKIVAGTRVHARLSLLACDSGLHAAVFPCHRNPVAVAKVECLCADGAGFPISKHSPCLEIGNAGLSRSAVV